VGTFWHYTVMLHDHDYCEVLTVTLTRDDEAYAQQYAAMCMANDFGHDPSRYATTLLNKKSHCADDSGGID
jgi:hypothetical protein